MADRILVTLDGKVQDPEVPLLFADDVAALRGDGVFETLLVRDGVAIDVPRHLARLARSAEMLELPPPNLDDWAAATEVAAKKWGATREGVLRLVMSRGREGGASPTAYVTVTPVPDRVYQARRDGISVMTLARGHSVDLAKNAPWQLLGAKTLSYATNMAALRFAARQGEDDVIFVSTEGRVLEGPRSTVVIARGRVLLTPPRSYGILPGTTQQALFDAATEAGFTCEYQPLFPADLITADGVWLVSSVTRAARVHTLDGLPLPSPQFGEQIAKLVDRPTVAKATGDSRRIGR
ncbi:MAG TPA: aminodeoxychorismate lyase [Aldersonia sp.]